MMSPQLMMWVKQGHKLILAFELHKDIQMYVFPVFMEKKFVFFKGQSDYKIMDLKNTQNQCHCDYYKFHFLKRHYQGKQGLSASENGNPYGSRQGL